MSRPNGAVMEAAPPDVVPGYRVLGWWRRVWQGWQDSRMNSGEGCLLPSLSLLPAFIIFLPQLFISLPRVCLSRSFFRPYFSPSPSLTPTPLFPPVLRKHGGSEWWTKCGGEGLRMSSWLYIVHRGNIFLSCYRYFLSSTRETQSGSLVWEKMYT